MLFGVFSPFTRLVDVLGPVQRMKQSSSRVVPQVFETTDTSGENTESNEPHRTIHSKRTYRMDKVWRADEVGHFFLTGATDTAGKHIQFYCRICRKDVPLLRHGIREILRLFQSTKHFPGDQRLRLEAPG